MFGEQQAHFQLKTRFPMREFGGWVWNIVWGFKGEPRGEFQQNEIKASV